MLPRRRFLCALAFLVSALPPSLANASGNTIGLLQHDSGTFLGYTLFSQMEYHVTHLIDNDGLLVHSWSTPHPAGNIAYLRPNGNLVRAADLDKTFFDVPGGKGGLVQEFDWDGQLLWEFEYNDSLHRTHHDVEPMPNGNVLIIAWEVKSGAEAIQAGRDPAALNIDALWPDHVLELQPDGMGGATVVWEWHVWDHLIQDFDPTKDNFGVVADHPELLDINYYLNTNANWLHCNAIDYNAELDQIVISSRNLNEIWVIDHSTTTAEAAGHTGGNSGRGGDILYRWGNPLAYRAGTAADQQLFNQHDARWIPSGYPGAGNLMVFNNGPRPIPGGDFSTVDEIVTTVDMNGDYPTPASGTPHGPASPTWSYAAPGFFSSFISGAHRLSNGNTLVCQGRDGRLFEIDALETKVWEYVVPVNESGPMVQGTIPVGTENRTFRAERYAPSYPAFDGRDLTPGDPIELPMGTDVTVAAPGTSFHLRPNYPNPFTNETTLTFALVAPTEVRLDIYDVAGRHVEEIVRGHLAAGAHRFEWQGRDRATGVYHYVLRANGESKAGSMILLR